MVYYLVRADSVQWLGLLLSGTHPECLAHLRPNIEKCAHSQRRKNKQTKMYPLPQEGNQTCAARPTLLRHWVTHTLGCPSLTQADWAYFTAFLCTLKKQIKEHRILLPDSGLAGRTFSV